MRKRSKKKKPGIIVAAVLAILLTGAFACNRISESLKTKEELMNFRNAEASLVLSEEGEVIGRFFYENRTNISFSQIPGHLKDALIATEDVRFYEHKGNDTRSFFRVLVKTIFFRNRSSGGGSTITQQLAKNMFGRKSTGLFHVPANKFREIILARRLEEVFSKDEILTLYLNTVSFGANVYGIEAASTLFFNKNVDQLKIEESAVLVGMLKANTYYNPHRNPENAKSRRNMVFSQMKKYNFLKSSEADSLSKLPLVLHYNSGSSGNADYFLVQVKNEAGKILDTLNIRTGKKWDVQKDGLIIETTLNFQLQKYALQSFKQHLPAMQKRLAEQYNSTSGMKTLEQITTGEIKRLRLTGRADEKRLQEIFSWNGYHSDSISVRDSLKNSLTTLHAGLLAIDPVTGGIKAWVGGIDYKTQPYDQVTARRQLASVFKPVLYSAALEDGMEPCYYLDNDSVSLSDFKDWSPENFDHSYGGKYSIAGALAQSMNIPTFSLYREIGFGKVDTMWRKMGFTFPLSNTPSLAMGTAEASIKEVTSAYAMLANGGFKINPYSITLIKTPDNNILYKHEESSVRERIISERTDILMNAMLQKAVREGTGASMNSVYGVDFPFAGKTGTSQDYSDAWFAAYDPSLVIVSRAGASTRSVHFNSGSNGSGSTLALPLVALTLDKVQHNQELKDRYFTNFDELPPELSGALDCPDFKDKNFFDRVIDSFERDRRTFDEKGARTDRKIRNFIRRIFRR